MTSGIYRIDLGNDWFYIGSAVNLERRENQHRTELNRKDHCNHRMQNCFNKYKIFVFAVLEQCSVDELLVREQFYLDQLFNDEKNVNLTLVAGNPMLGRKHSVETRAKMSAAHKGKVLSAETRAKMSAASKGKSKSVETRAKLSARVVSAETRAKLSAAKLGRTVSPETRAKLSAAQKGKVLSAEHCANMVAAWAVRKAEAA